MSFLLRLAIHVFISAVALWGIDIYLFGEAFSIVGEGPERYVIVALMFGLLNVFVRPVLKVLLLPIKVLTLGLAGLAVNGILLALIAVALEVFQIGGASMAVESWVTYLFVGIVMSIVNTVVHWAD